MDIAGSGLSAQRQWMDLISGNIANARTTHTDEGGPYQRKMAVFSELLDAEGRSHGVAVTQQVDDQSEGIKAFEPTHPDADASGYVLYPNVNVMAEMVDLIAASRAYEANATILEAAKSSFQRSISLLQA
jgi:flagellar basal-body rod protein FlgC